MLDKLDFMLRFWALRARHAALGEPLDPVEQVELLSLIRMLASDHALPGMGPVPRGDERVPVQLTGPSGFLVGELRMVCAGGLVIAVESLLTPGQCTIVRLADAVIGVEYTLPCSVLWSFAGAPPAMALRVDGAPTRTTFALPEPGSARAPFDLSWGEWPRARVG